MSIEETLEQDIKPPIAVHESPIPDQMWALFRQLLPLIVGALVLRGYIENDVAEIISILLGVVLPIGWGQMKTRLRALQLSSVEKRVSDTILTTKAKAAG